MDPYQLARSAQTLQAAGLPVEEYNQTLNNLTEITEALYSVLTTRGIRLYNAPDLREHILNAVSVETPRGIRLSKQKTSRKIDAAVALSFSVLAAIQAGKPPSLEELRNYRPPEVEFMTITPVQLAYNHLGSAERYCHQYGHQCEDDTRCDEKKQGENFVLQSEPTPNRG